MCNFKISKKDALSDTRSSIFDLHEKKIKFFETRKSNIQLYNEELSLLKNELNEINNNQQKVFLNEKIRSLEELINNITNDTDLNEYLLEFITIIYNSSTQNEHHTDNKGILDTFVNSKIVNDKTELYNEYIKKFNPELKLINENKKFQQRHCSSCMINNFIFDVKNSEEICKNCGASTYLIGIDDFNNTLVENNQDTKNNNMSFNYKRNNHFQECLNQMQAKENTTIPPRIIKDLTFEFKKYNITDPKYITYSLVKSYLRKLKYNKYYEHIPTIINEFCGLRAPVLTSQLEQELKIMFDQIQAPFEKWSKIISPARKNFLNYNYIFFKMCQSLKKDEFLSIFPLLKNREKLYEHDQIWRGICKELNWNFIPSI